MGKCQNGMEGKPCASFAWGDRVMEQMSNPTEAVYVDEQVRVEHYVQADSAFCHWADRSANESIGACTGSNVQRCYRN